MPYWEAWLEIHRIRSVSSAMCNLDVQSASKIFIIAWLSAEDNFNYSGISMDEEAL